MKEWLYLSYIPSQHFKSIKGLLLQQSL